MAPTPRPGQPGFIGPLTNQNMLGGVTGVKRKSGEVDKARQLVENLWGLGPGDDKIRGAMEVFKVWQAEGRGSYDDFTRALWRHIGIDAGVVTRAEKLGAWRANPKDSFKDRVGYLFKDGFGGGDEEKWKVNNLAWEIAAGEAKGPGGTIRPAGQKPGEPQERHYIEAMRRLLKPETFTNAMIKIGAGEMLKDPKIRGNAPEWNPWRGDGPKKPPATGPAGGAQGAGFPGTQPPKPGAKPPGGGGGMPGGGGGLTAGPGGGAVGAGPGTPAYVDTSPPPRTPEEKIAYVKRHYGSNAWFLDIPEVRDKLMAAAADEVSLDELGNRLAETTWWKVTDENARVWYAQERADPASALRAVTRKSADVELKARELGITLDPARARAIAESAVRYGWTDVEMRQAMASELEYDPTEMQGSMIQSLKEKASDYFLPLTEDQLRKWGKDLVGGIVQDTDFDQFLKDQAKGFIPSLSDSIDRGLTVKQVSDQFYGHAAEMLGVNKESIDFKDPKWLAPLNAVDEKGTRRMMTMEEWDTKLRTDPKYGYSKTQKAKDEARSLANEIAGMFGAKGGR